MASDQAPSAIQKVKVKRSDSDSATTDQVVVEEPLEIRIKKGDIEQQLGITMRTPGADLQLAAGFLWGEGFLTDPKQLITVKVCGDRSLTPRQRANVVIAEVTAEAPDFSRQLDRRFTMNSACGVCGSENISDLHKRGIQKVAPTTKSDSELSKYTELLDKNQAIFSKTGGLHAALLIDPSGELRYSKEDVGRHNAVDKVIGQALMDGLLPLSDWTMVVSGRTGYEIVQKCVTAGVSAMVGVSAPTSLAIELANEFGLTLIAFARDGVGKRFIEPLNL